MSIENSRKKRKEVKANTTFIRFAQYQKDRSIVFCFFEGEDSKYYGGRVKNFTRKESRYFDCGGKQNVLEVHRLISAKQEYADVLVAYFIDRDFDPSIHTENNVEKYANIYETPCYSIENFYTSLDCFQEILRCEFNLSDLDDDFSKCSQLYQNRQQEFHDIAGILNAWVALQRGKKAEVNLSDFKLDKFIQVSLESIGSTYNVEILAGKFSESATLTEDEINNKLNELCSQNCQKSFRGKFELYFLYKFLDALVSDANQKSPKYFSEKLKVSFQFSPKTMISDLSQYADTPNCLIYYLERHKKPIFI